MATDHTNDARAFRDFLDVKLSDVGPGLTLDDALDLWEYENQTGREREESVRAIRRGLDDMHAGRTEDAFAFVERMRQGIRRADGR